MIPHANRALQANARLQLSLRSLLGFLRQRPAEAIPPDYDDLWFLYRAVRRRKPRVILEFGSGCSTVILAQALWANSRNGRDQPGRLHTVEADPHWARVTEGMMPQHLRGLAEVRYSPLEEVEYAGVLGFRHARAPDVAPDFLYLDGPAHTAERRVSTDVLEMEDRFGRGFYMVIDGRWENTVLLQNHLKKRYAFSRRWASDTNVFELTG